MPYSLIKAPISCKLPAPPIIVSGSDIDFRIRSTSFESYPFIIPSWSIELITISPAPSFSILVANSSGLIPVAFFPL